MNKILPEIFDANEWFIIISYCIVAPIPFFLPKRLPTIVTIVLLSVAIGVPMYADFIVGTPPIDLYDVNESENHELLDIALYYLNVPFSYIFIYLFDKWRLTGLWIVLYVLSCSIASTAYEALAVYFHVYTYKGWKLEYSFVFYLAIQSFYIWLYYVIKKKYNQTKQEKGLEWI